MGFHCCLPHLIPKHVLNRTTLAISDGDYQKFTQLDAAIATHLPQCIWDRCGWHTVDRGWKSRCPLDFKEEKQKCVIKMIKACLYSFMKAYCETKDKYNISKSLLLKYVDSKFLKKTLGDIATRTIILYLRTYFFVHEDKFVFYKRRDI